MKKNQLYHKKIHIVFFSLNSSMAYLPGPQVWTNLINMVDITFSIISYMWMKKIR